MPSVLQLTLILLAFGVAGVLIFRYFGLPPILGYLAIGVLIGPNALALANDSATVKYLGEFGVVFLMFSLGLEFNLHRLRSMRRIVFGLGASQVILTMLLAVPASLFMNWIYPISWQAAIALGGALAMSSTAIVTKLIADRSELESQHGRNVIGILLFQDLAVVFLLILLPSLGKNPKDLLFALSTAGIKIAIALVLIFYIGQTVMSRWFRLVVKLRSQELFMLNLLLIVLGMAALTEHFGLSLALGAFLAGMLISETPFRHQVEEDIKPFRDVLLGLFFITIGMLLDFKVIQAQWALVLLLLIGPLIFKFGLIALLSRAFGSSPGISIRTGLCLAQAGEFGFVLLNQIDGLDLIDPALSQAVLAAMLLSMFGAPFLIQYSDRIAMRFSSNEWLLQSLALTQLAAKSVRTTNHVLICGFGRSGQSLARMLDQQKIPYLALDMDPDRVKEAAAAGDNVVYGDASRENYLTAAGLSKAKAVVITYADTPATLKVLHQVERLRPGMIVLVRTKDDADLGKLQAAGATEVVPELIEGSLMMASHVLLMMGVPLRKVVRQITSAREARYSLLRGYFRGSVETESEPNESWRLQSITLLPESASIGKTLEELHLENEGVSVQAVRRKVGGMDYIKLELSPELRLQANDILVLSGNPEATDLAQAKLI
ncbi:monovalent cation:proton antiporter family protein [Polynucleobacter paneuropaeus]|jgi:CPA2 family monovalent cation:H+ antiporter-2|uniref:Potassium transporter n=1 Tax=Polynucleobacter paneuropaeus TaxID=2527775 RepID=A0A2Z4JU62_9BURK|nr:monovalent cation:proton antiporter family protein [Polynucleobacter paneuropaeus]AWW45045.1 potassium transporter [Polynucleobacter paneuropaeus]AWW48579.1 potassium transporter [Polynucleobacter paneuropaeus]AWW50414.1 potassium transporter [Polynucleobacter paneuropaeus]MBT8516819.1 potassium transporter [Polynucleobacter paneuropaeus]MBT8517622.1 potassium transporter [Polynucleobacter paneuropaeus]